MVIELRKYFLTIASTLFLVFTMWMFGNSQLGGFDMSALVDTGWRMANGQVPYVDFPLTTPVAFFVGAGWAVQFFGAAWSSFVLAAIVFAVFAFLAQTYLLNLIIPWKPAIAVSLVCQLLCSGVISYWWYNSIVMSSACLFLSAAYVFAARPTDSISSFGLWATLTLLSLMKPNIAGSLAVLVIFSLFLILPNRSRIFLICIAALCSFFLILFFLKISPLDVIQSYIEVGRGRAVPTIKWFFNDKGYEYLVVIPLLLLCLLPLLGYMNEIKDSPSSSALVIKAYIALTLISLLVGFISLVTNSDSNLIVGLPFFLLSSAIFCFFTKSSLVQLVPNRIWRIGSVICVVAVLTGCMIMQVSQYQNIMTNMTPFLFIGTIIVGLAVLFFLFLGRNHKGNEFFLNIFDPNNIIWTTLLISAAVALFAGGMRWRVSYIGVDAFFSSSPLTEIQDIPFFKHFQISSSAKNTILEIQDVLNENYENQQDWRNASVYFGPRIEFAYAAFGVASPLNLPIWWHPDNSYPKAYTDEFAQSFLSHNFKICIFMKIPGQRIPDLGFLPDRVVKNLQLNYQQMEYPNIVVYYIK